MSAPIPLNVGKAKPGTVDLEAEADLGRCGALKDYWYVACLAEELGSKPIQRIVFGMPIVLFRDAQGKPAALVDRCLHRNARLSAGVVIDGRLCCPYHGWVYDADGRVVEVPSLGPSQRSEGEGADTCAREGLCTAPGELGRARRFATTEQDGLVYVFMGGEDPARARKPPFRVPKWGEPGWAVYFMVTRFPNGVTNLVENFMDVPHTVFVHAGWFRNPTKKAVPATVDRRNGEVLVTYEQDKDQISGLGRIFNPRGEAMVHTDHYFVPNITRVDYAFGETSGFVINSQVTPIGATDSMVYTAISYRLPFDVPGALVAKALRPIVKWYTTQVIRQDVEIMEIQRQGLTSMPGGGAFRSTEADLLHADIEAYRTWLREGGEGDGPPDALRRIRFYI